MFRTILVHHQEQLYKLYIAFGICRYHTSGYCVDIATQQFHDNLHTDVLNLLALRPGHLFPPRKYSRYSFLLKAESTPGPYVYEGLLIFSVFNVFFYFS